MDEQCFADAGARAHRGSPSGRAALVVSVLLGISGASGCSCSARSDGPAGDGSVVEDASIPDTGPMADTGPAPIDAGHPDAGPAVGCEGADCPSSSDLWTFGDDGGDNARAVAIGPEGNLYVAAWTGAALDFGEGPDTPFGRNDLVLVSFTPTLEPRWSVRMGGPETEDPRSMVVDPTGHIHLVGGFEGTAAFGPFELTAVDRDAFYCRVAPSGTVVDALALGGPGDQLATDIALAPDGTRVLGGTFEESVTLRGETVEALGGTDAFVAALEPDGSVRWWRAFGGVEDDVAHGVAVDDAGNAYVVGDFRDTMRLAGTELAAGGAIGTAGYLAGWGPGGEALWARALAGEWRITAMDVAWTPAAELLVALDSSGELGALVLARYAATGEWLSQSAWRDGIIAGGTGHFRNLAFDAEGNLHVAGIFSDQLELASDLVLENERRGTYEGFVASFTPALVPRWGRSFGGPGNDWAVGVAVDPSGDLVAVVGGFEDTADFGVATVASEGAWDGYLLVLR